MPAGVSAEGVGFEPTEACASLVFKTSTFVRSVIPPESLVWHRSPSTRTPFPVLWAGVLENVALEPGVRVLGEGEWNRRPEGRLLHWIPEADQARSFAF